MQLHVYVKTNPRPTEYVTQVEAIRVVPKNVMPKSYAHTFKCKLDFSIPVSRDTHLQTKLPFCHTNCNAIVLWPRVGVRSLNALTLILHLMDLKRIL